MCTDFFRHIAMFGGAPQPDFFALWMGANFTPFQFALRVPPLVRALVSHIANSPLKRLWWPQLKKRMTRIMKGFQRQTPTRPTRELFAKLMLDGKTRATFPMPQDPSGALADIVVPFVLVQNPGYLNLHQFGSYDLFENAGTPRDRRWLIVAPASYDLPVYHWQLEALAFFDHLLYGADNGYTAQARVRYWTQGAGVYGSADDWPLPGSTPIRLYLASNDADADTNWLAREPGQTGANRWAAVPLGATVVAGFDDLVPGVPVTLRFSLTPQPVVLKPGERLRLDIASRTDLLRSDVSHGHAQFDMQVPPYFSRNTLHYGPNSFIEMRQRRVDLGEGRASALRRPAD
jgi:uncharacterized protein